MFRIGIIGTENSHAMGFATYYNVTAPGTAKVVGVMGDSESATAVAAKAGVEFVAQSVEDFFGKVDAMMVTSRAGSVHKKYIMPFVKAGMPVFIDKPFTSSVKDAEELIAELRKSGSLVMGGSGLKYIADVAELKQKVADMRKNGKFITACMNFNVMLTSPYDGIYFYAPHLTEMCLEIFGHDVTAVQADRAGDNLHVTVFYPDDAVTLLFSATAPAQGCLLVGKDGNEYKNIDISEFNKEEAVRFANMLESKKQPHELDEYLLPIKMIDLIEKSAKNGKKLDMRG